MDLHLMLAAPSEQERAAVNELLGEPTSGWHGAERDETTHRVARGGRAAREQRDLLLPALHALQARVGWISQGGLNYVSERLTVPPAEAYGVATFYAMFSVGPRARTVVHACDDIACRIAGGLQVCESLEVAFGQPASAEGEVTWVRSPCLGMCERAPAALVQTSGERTREVAHGHVASHQVEHLITDTIAGNELVRPTDPNCPSAPQTWDASGREHLRLLRRVGAVDPSSIEDYRSHHGYEALRRAIQIGPQETLREITDAKLLGRGGAAFPTGVKWKAVSEQPEHPHFFICNADESEPGTFKDRVVMEEDPFAVVEALTIAGITTGCAQGYLYIRGEYPLATSRLEHAILEARRRGLLGADIMGHGIEFDIEVRRGAGAYICGEETALFNSLEGKRGEPRNKPPFPVHRGLFGKPTGINNVETLINVLEVLRIGSQAYAALGTEGSTGTRLFCVAGSVASPGLYEAEHGVSLADVLALAGGVEGELKAVLLGGAAGGFVGPDRLDISLTFEDAREGGYTLGSGVVLAMNASVDLVDTCLRIASFFRDESCGQCVPCRVGTVRQEEALHRLATERTIGSRDDEMALLADVAQVMRDASICGLGQTAANAVQSAIEGLGVFAGAGVAPAVRSGAADGEVVTPTEEQES